MEFWRLSRSVREVEGLAVSLLLAILLTTNVEVQTSEVVSSSNPILVIVTDALVGFVVGRDGDKDLLPVALDAAGAILRDGTGTVAGRVWRVVGFALWDASGEVEYAYEFDVGKFHVRRWAKIRNGRVETTATLTGYFDEPRLQSVTLRLVASEESKGTVIACSLSADICTGRDGRLARRIVAARACPELSGNMDRIVAAGRKASAEGRQVLRSMIQRFIERKP